MYCNRLLLFAAVILISSCGLIYLGDLGVSVYPANPDDILGTAENINVSFTEEVDKLSFESAFQLTGVSGSEDGDFNWDGDSVEFIANEAMRPGFRYRLKITGEIKTADGKTFSKNINIPFYYLHDALPPVLVLSNPENAAIAEIDTQLILTFSKSMDAESFEKHFNLTPNTDHSTVWNSDSTKVTITPEQGWINLQYYRWSLSDEITDLSDIPLPENFNGSFLVQTDTLAPDITAVYPAADNGDGSFTILTALTLEDLQTGNHIAVEFTEDIDFFSLRQCLSFAPSIDGYIVSLNPDTALYYIDENLPPGCDYEITIAEGLEDSSGNASTSEWIMTFTPDIPVQRINSIDIEDQNGVYTNLASADFNNDGFINTPGLNYYGSNSLHFVIHLSEAYPDLFVNQRMAFESTIGISPVFPPGTASPSVFSSTWETETRLRLIYEGFSSFAPGEPVFYRFDINTGSADSSAAGGSYLTEGISFVFLAEAQ